VVRSRKDRSTRSGNRLTNCRSGIPFSRTGGQSPKPISQTSRESAEISSYAQMDEIGARESAFGRRVAHGYLVLAAAAGLFVDPAPGPVLANYGLENLRFTKPVVAGDTLQVRLTCKSKRPKEGEDRGIVEWDVTVFNQDREEVASYVLLTLVRRSLSNAKVGVSSGINIFRLQFQNMLRTCGSIARRSMR